jgi:hypothetical protein
MADENETVDGASDVIKQSLQQCRTIVSDYRSLIVANSNLPEAAEEVEGPAPPQGQPEA